MNRGSPLIFNLLTVLVLLLSCLVGAYSLLVVVNPNSAPNVMRPQALPTIMPTLTPSGTALIDIFPTEIPTRGPTDTGAPVSATPTVTASPTAPASLTITASVTATSGATLTPSRTATATRTRTQPASATPSGPTAVPTRTLSPLPFTLQPGSPTYIPNYANAAGCNWMGIAGQAFDLSGRPIIGLIVRVFFQGGTIDALTGTNKSYGEGGYEVYLNDHVEATTGAYSIQLLNASTSPLSDIFAISTLADCNRNLIVVNFVQNH